MTKEACRQAGFKRVYSIEAPIAALMAFGLIRSRKKRNIMVFDFGGSYLEISILTNNNNDCKYTVEYTRVLLNHGGRAITEQIVDFCIDLLEQDNVAFSDSIK